MEPSEVEPSAVVPYVVVGAVALAEASYVECEVVEKSKDQSDYGYSAPSVGAFAEAFVAASAEPASAGVEASAKASAWADTSRTSVDNTSRGVDTRVDTSYTCATGAVEESGSVVGYRKAAACPAGRTASDS